LKGETFPSSKISKRKQRIEYDSDEIESQHENLRNTELNTEPSKSNIKIKVSNLNLVLIQLESRLKK
jgi:hypothetical protein